MAFLLVSAVPARAREGLGVGIILGEPTGVTTKAWLTPETAFVLAAAWSFTDEDGMGFHGDYLIHNDNAFRGAGRFPFTYGLGARVKLGGEDPVVGVRVPLGVSFFPSQPWELFLELAPILDVTPDTEPGLGAAVGLRYTLR